MIKKVIALDGPAGSGKSTVARAVADRLGLAYLDTGAMYRAVACASLRRGIDPSDTTKVAELARELSLEMGEQVIVDGLDATDEIRTPEVTVAVTAVASNPEVRQEMVARQRQWVTEHGGGVVEGRDIGSVVFPEADLKIYLTADVEERERRRREEAGEAVAADIARRDQADSTRAVSPLTVAADAVVIDTTDCEIQQVVDRVIAMVGS